MPVSSDREACVMRTLRAALNPLRFLTRAKGVLPCALSAVAEGNGRMRPAHARGAEKHGVLPAATKESVPNRSLSANHTNDSQLKRNVPTKGDSLFLPDRIAAQSTCACRLGSDDIGIVTQTDSIFPHISSRLVPASAC